MERSSIHALAAMMAGVMLAACGGGESPPDAGGSGAVGTATLSWSAPVENSDGSAITNLAGYRIYHGTNAKALNNLVQVSSPGITLYVIDSLPSGTHYFSITAYNTAGGESDRSAVGSKKVQ